MKNKNVLASCMLFCTFSCCLSSSAFASENIPAKTNLSFGTYQTLGDEYSEAEKTEEVSETNKISKAKNIATIVKAIFVSSVLALPFMMYYFGDYFVKKGNSPSESRDTPPDTQPNTPPPYWCYHPNYIIKDDDKSTVNLLECSKIEDPGERVPYIWNRDDMCSVNYEKDADGFEFVDEIPCLDIPDEKDRRIS